jgi:hypothetical protein
VRSSTAKLRAPLLAGVRRAIRDHGGEPSSGHVDELLDERLAHRDPSDSGRGDSCGLVAASMTSDGVVAVIGDVSAPLTSDQWARAAVTLAADVGASEIAVEGFAARETYMRVVNDALRRCRRRGHGLVPKGVGPGIRIRLRRSPGDCLQLRHRRRLDLPLELKRYRLFHARLGSISASRLHGKNRSEDTARRPRVGEELRLPLTGRGCSTTALQPIA